MAEKHPYMSGSGPLFQIVEQLRKSFPATVTAETLKKLGLAPNNEGYVINILRFINALDQEGKKTAEGAKVFTQHANDSFQKAFSKLVKDAYGDLFTLHGDSAWSLDQNKLIQYFRSTDETSGVVGRRQATTFQALSAIAGKAEPPTTRTTDAKAKATKSQKGATVKPKAAAPPTPSPIDVSAAKRARDVGLTVRVEINLPADADQPTYDRIFKSLRENLIDVE
ncbi:MAG: DUF5343 domain-containing protein [Vicinamibacteria bacterium]